MLRISCFGINMHVVIYYQLSCMFNWVISLENRKTWLKVSYISLTLDGQTDILDWMDRMDRLWLISDIALTYSLRPNKRKLKTPQYGWQSAGTCTVWATMSTYSLDDQNNIWLQISLHFSCTKQRPPWQSIQHILALKAAVNTSLQHLLHTASLHLLCSFSTKHQSR